VVFQCCEEVGQKWSTAEYCLLGDDIILGNKELGEAYRRRITKLGIEASDSKTHVSCDMFEFAKRVFIQGEEVTPFSVSSVSRNLELYPLLVAGLRGEVEKGYRYVGGIPGAVESLYESLKMPRRFRRNIKRLSNLCYIGTATLQGRVAPADFITVVGRDGVLVPEGFRVKEEVGDHILRTACLTMYADGMEDGKGEALGDLAIALVCYLTSLPDCPASEPAITALPHLAIHGQVEEAYLRAGKEALWFDTGEGGDGIWPFVQSLALPLDDRVYSERKYEVLHRVSAGLRPHILNHLKGLTLYASKGE